MKILKVFTVFLLVCYAVICAFMYSQQRSLLYFPQAEHPDFPNIYRDSEMKFTNGDISLHGWGNVRNVSLENPVVFYYGGNGDEASRNLTLLADMGFQNFIAMNYRGYGRSGGEPEEQDLKNDALFIFDKVSKQYGLDSDSIILMGRSLGSGIATYVASERDVNKVVLITPYDSIVNVASKRFPLFPVSLLMHQRFESNKLAPFIEEPVLCLIAEYDEIIPSYHAHQLCDKWKGNMQKKIIAEATHNNITRHHDFAKAISLFVR